MFCSLDCIFIHVTEKWKQQNAACYNVFKLSAQLDPLEERRASEEMAEIPRVLSEM